MLKRLLRIRREEASFARRQFRCARDSARQRLERVGETFLEGYHAALADEGMNVLSARLEDIKPEFRGFAYEGAAMALDILDQLTPWRARRVEMFLRGPGEPHIYMAHVGIGWSMARLPLRVGRRLKRLDPVLRWLACDGWGFHEGYFHGSRYLGGRTLPKGLSGYALQVFDQGLGRSLWFMGGADPEWIAATVAAFPNPRHRDLWSGVGLACAYAGGADGGEIRSLRLLAGAYRSHLAQGVVFAAGARQRAGNPAPHTELACRLLCGVSAKEAAAISEETLPQAKENSEPAYEDWRRLIRLRISSETILEGSDAECGAEAASAAGREMEHVTRSPF